MSELNGGLLTIVPREPDSRHGYSLTNGTKVLLDGKELKGVTKVVISGSPNEVWRAKIECMVNVSTMPGMLLEVVEVTPITWWRRVLLRLAGFTVDTTSLSNVDGRPMGSRDGKW